MRKISKLFGLGTALAVGAMLSTAVYAEDGVFDKTQYGEELAPGFDQCMENSGGVTSEMLACYDHAQVYWKGRLNELNAQRLAKCADDMEPKECIASAKKAQKALDDYLEVVGDTYILMPTYSENGSLGLVTFADDFTHLLRDNVKYLDMAINEPDYE